MTIDNTVIMGRKTYNSIGKALSKRRNMIISSSVIGDKHVESFNNILTAIQASSGDIWIIGGQSIYEQALYLCNELWLTIVPKKIEYKTTDKVARFPFIDPTIWNIELLPSLDCDNIVENWHNGPSEESLCERLGLTTEQMGIWIDGLRIAKYVRKS